jgi:DNA-binding NarL/FixJ family response regulator
MPIRVYILDDESMLRAAFRSLLGQREGFDVVGANGDAREALDQLEELRPDVLLLDITMPTLSGLDAIPLIKKRTPRTRIMMLTSHESETFVRKALQAGAAGYISKDSDPAELVLGIEAVHRGDPYLSPKVAAGLVSGVRQGAVGKETITTRLASLTPREREVFQLLALGKSNKEVARELDISLGTAKKHRENLQRKLQVSSTAEIARIAIREGLLNA